MERLTKHKHGDYYMLDERYGSLAVMKLGKLEDIEERVGMPLTEYIKKLENGCGEPDHDLDWYKHEYYSECERAEQLEKALNIACKELYENDLCFLDVIKQKSKNLYDFCKEKQKTKEQWKEKLMEEAED